jgi:aminoglycoside phosphotransferase (APT) family kinase protein
MDDIAPRGAVMTELSKLLGDRLSVVYGRPVDVAGLRRLSGGASRETWAFDADGEALILRREPPEALLGEMGREAAALTLAARGGVPVPRLVDHGDGDGTLGAPYMIMERLTGETIPRRLLRDEAYAGVRPRLARELGEILARIHALPPGEVPGLPDGDPLAGLAGVYEELGEPRPAIEIALRWLRRHRPPATGDAIVHGDFRNGNLMIAPDGVRGVLDWELTHRGDPAEDLGWLCVKAWRFGAPAPVGGFGTRADLLAGYAAAGGDVPPAETLRWWEVYGTLRWAVLCRYQAERYLSGADPSIELAALGRRVCEQEHDLLLILGLTEARTVQDPLDGLPAEPSPPHDRPGAPALLAAVRAFLTDEVMTDERLRYHALVAASVLRIAQRELLLGDDHRAAHRRRLEALGCRDDAGLAQAIRDGRLDDRYDEVTAAVRDGVVDKLIVASPRHLAIPGE